VNSSPPRDQDCLFSALRICVGRSWRDAQALPVPFPILSTQLFELPRCTKEGKLSFAPFLSFLFSLHSPCQPSLSEVNLFPKPPLSRSYNGDQTPVTQRSFFSSLILPMIKMPRSILHTERSSENYGSPPSFLPSFQFVILLASSSFCCGSVIPLVLFLPLLYT